MSLRTTIARVWVLPTPTVSANPIRSLANEYVAVDESPDPKNVGLYTPSILALPGGRLVAGYERGIARWWTSMVMISRSCRAVVMPAPKARMILSRCTARKGFGSWFIKV